MLVYKVASNILHDLDEFSMIILDKWGIAGTRMLLYVFNFCQEFSF